MKLRRKHLAYTGAGLSIVLVVILIFITRHMRETRKLATANAVTVQKTPARQPYERLRAVHYFADTYPKQFLNSFEPADVARDFAQIKADGFNAVVLVLPWAEFQPSVDSNAHDERMFQRLQLLMDAASKLGLGVALRLSYFWTYRPDAENGIFERMHHLFHDEKTREAWLNHLALMHQRVGKHPAFRLAFLSWEDLYPMALTSASAILQDQNILRMYRDYLARTGNLYEISTLYGKTFASWNEVPFPDRKTPAYAKVLDYWDDALIHRLYAPAQQRFPNLSFEVRGDWDPVWDKDGTVTWKNHATTYALPGTNTLTAYYATSWGMKNAGDFVSAADALKGFDRFIEHLDPNKRRQHLFIDQFLFYYELEEFKNNTQIEPDERDQFLYGIAQRFRDQNISYALWYYRDYVDNAVYNAHFSLGFDGWRASTGAEIVTLPNGRAAAALNKGDQITQKVPVQQRSTWKGGDKPIDICITRDGGPPTSVEVMSGTQNVAIKWREDEKRSCGKITRAGELEVSIKATVAPVKIDLVEVFTVLEPSAVYDRALNPGTQLEAIRKLNALAGSERSATKHRTGDD